ncbi:MAM and LDL-receptor class A domain-containing protein 2 [Holothuria leucospilota]|uniref:Scavenger receptor cysteine-rich domain-containing protein DMBT1 n=1 Tax=Holothuria leucospilota TaxID=206669 RepID=A0A9Q0YK50_HOLLE|nr:MAM and LDL-receptor class A domain-containing protein 2 [Holothuria leucospilota]
MLVLQRALILTSILSYANVAYGWTTPASVLTNSGTIRLVGGSSQYEGRVEIFYDGQWGTVCDDYWHDIDAAVVCRQLGYSSNALALSNAAFGQGSGRIWLDDVACTGNENMLQECRSNGWGSNNCRHYEDAGVHCLVIDLSCTFEHGTCGFFQGGNDNFDWTRYSGSTTSLNTGPSGDHTTGAGYYMYIEATGRAANSKARLISHSQDATVGQGLCLVFFYHMFGDTINTLNVYLYSGGNEKLIFTRSQNQGDNWWRATVQFRSFSTWRIIFEGIRGTDFTGDIAVDDISIFPGLCPSEDLPTTWPDLSMTTLYDITSLNNEYSDVSCTFEYGSCGYNQMADDDFDWTRHQGATPSYRTGPPGDHTTGRGYYMYIEATSKAANSIARLISPPQDATDDQGLCLVFFYHMYGDTINTLNVYLSSGGNEGLIFTRSQNQGDKWWQATVQFRSLSKWRIIFEGIRGTDFTGDIAVDDISIFPRLCPSGDLPTTPPADLFMTTFPVITYSNPLTEVVFVDSVYNFASPNFPGNYPNHLSAKWLFSTFDGFQLLVKFRVLDTEEYYDRVRVGSGNTPDRSYALHWSGGQPESDVQFLSSGNTFWMTLETDFSVTSSGFAGSVEAVRMSLGDLNCDDFSCGSDGVCIPHRRVCDSVTNCGSKYDEENCPGWNTGQPVMEWSTVVMEWSTVEPSNFDEISLHCGPTSFQVDIPMQLLPDDMQPNDLYLSKDPFDPRCRGFQNGNYYFSLNSSLTGCGTVYVENKTMSSYLNWVVNTKITSSVVEYQGDYFPVTCDFDRSKQLQSHFVITNESYERVKRAKGSLVYDFSVYRDVNFDTRYNSYPIETTLNSNLYCRAELLRSPENLRIHLRSCHATPSPNFDDVVVYELIHDGCVINNEYVRVLTPSKRSQADFEIRSFRFKPDLSNYTSQVWIHCEVVVCDVNDPSSECLYDRERSRRRRSLAESSKEAKRLIQGPIFFTDIEDLDQRCGSFISMREHGEVNIFTVALTAVSLVMFLSLLVVGGVLIRIMRTVKGLKYRPLQNERYTTI